MNVKKIKEKIKNNPSRNVDLYIDTVEDLFSHDNYGNKNRLTLNDKVDEYLLNAAKEITIKYSIKVIIHTKSFSDYEKSVSRKIIKEYYRKKTHILFEERKKKAKQWRIRLLFGILFLAICHGISLLFALAGETSFSNLMQDSFEIMGWVAIWEPALYFLFTRKEEAYELSDYLQLENSDIDFITQEE